MSDTGTESGETPVDHPPGRAEIIRRSLEAMNDNNIRQIRNVYQRPVAEPETNGMAADDDGRTDAPDEATEEPTR